MRVHVRISNRFVCILGRNTDPGLQPIAENHYLALWTTALPRFVDDMEFRLHFLSLHTLGRMK